MGFFVVVLRVLCFVR